MNAIAAAIEAYQVGERAAVLQAEAVAAREAAVVDSAKARCAALVDEFNTTPMTLRRAITSSYATRAGAAPTLSEYASTGSYKNLENTMDGHIAAGLRIYLVWWGSYLVATFNAQTTHLSELSPYYEAAQNGYYPDSAAVLSECEARKELAVPVTLPLDVVELAVSRYKLDCSPNPERAMVGCVMRDGRYSYEGPRRPAKPEFDLPADFIAAVMKPMLPFLVLGAPVAAPTEPTT